MREQKVGEFAVVKVSPWVEHIPTAWMVRDHLGTHVAAFGNEADAFAEASRLNAIEMRRRANGDDNGPR